MDFYSQNENGFYGPTYEEWQAQILAEQLEKERLIASAIEKLAMLGLSEAEARAIAGL